MNSWSVAEMLASLRSGRATSQQLVEIAVDRARQCATDLNAFAAISDKASASAMASDRKYREGTARKPEGIPVAVKDIIDTMGIETRYGSPAYIGHIPASDATVVRRLREAGAIVVGKTTTHEFAWGVTTSSPKFGDTLNPADPARIPGGSSGGAAAAVAYGAVPACLGTDTGGSVRIPSALCGVIGLKPTYGALPTDGVFPLAPTLDHIGMVCRKAEDLPVLADALGMKISRSERRIRRKIGLFKSPGDVPIDDEIARDFERTGEELSRGHSVIEVDVQLDEAYSIFATLVLAEGGLVHFSRNSLSFINDHYGKETIARLERARAVRLGDFANAQEARRLFTSKLDSLFGEIELLLLPTCPCPAPLIGENSVRIGDWRGDIRHALMAYTAPFNLTGYPVATVPMRRRDGLLPAGLQIVGHRGHDNEVIEAAIEIERRNAESNNLKEDKDERDGTKNKPDPV
jgi:aspartyl-tRNA(Asn)/glutamyl-tRNA(Gln) amidotransferase subunit A